MNRFWILLLVLIGCSVLAYPQKNVLRKANKAYKSQNYYNSLQKFLHYKELVNHRVTTDVMAKIANCYFYLNDYTKAKEYFDQIDREILIPDDVANYAELLQHLGLYKKAFAMFELAITKGAKKPLLKKHKESCYWALMNIQKSEEYFVQLSNIETNGLSFGVQYYKNGIVFSGNINQYNENADKRGYPFLDLLILSFSKIKNNTFEPQIFSENLLANYHVGAVSFTANYDTIFFTRVERSFKSKKHKGILKIYSAVYKGKEWKNITELSFNSEKYSCAHPSISKNGDILFFSSDMPGGYGGKDIYLVKKDKNGWGKPQNLGNAVNTKGDEVFPFIGNDNKLYFSSNGHLGYGGLDIYYAIYWDEKWTNVTNLRKPVNSSKDDFGFVINPDNQQQGFISSNRIGNGQKDYIYTIEKRETHQDKRQVFAIEDERAFLVDKDNVPFENSQTSSTSTTTVSIASGNNDSEKDDDEIVYKVQLYASQKPIDYIEAPEGFYVFRYYHKGLYKYTIGEFKDLKMADKLKQMVIQLGYSDAFVIAFKNNRRINIKIY